MTLKEFISLIKKNYWLIILPVVIIFVGVIWFNSKIDRTYEGNIGFSIVRIGQTSKSEFNDFYATQADNLVTANFAKWMAGKPFIASVYQKAGENLDNKNLDKMVKKFTVQKTSGADISVSFQTLGRDETQKLGQALIDEVSLRTAEIKKESKSDQNLRGLELSSKLSVHQQATNKLLNYLLGILAGIILGIILILSVRYFSLSSKTP